MRKTIETGIAECYNGEATQDILGGFFEGGEVMGYTHFTETQRLQLEGFLKAGMDKKEIAKVLKKHISSIYREIKRGQCERKHSDLTTEYTYDGHFSENRYRGHLKDKGRELKIGDDQDLIAFIEQKIGVEGYSPAAALGEIKAIDIQFKRSISETTLYKYIDIGLFSNITNKDLPIKRCRKERKNKLVRPKRPPKGKSIEERPKEINKREDFGHWEMDCVVGKQGTTAALLVLTERMLRQEIVRKMSDKTTGSVVEQIDRLEQELGPERFRMIFKTITVDNGSEFQDVEGIERHISGEGKRTTMYFCHPYCSSERGSNENQNKLIRRHYPKGTDFTNVKQEDVDKVESWINNYPREIFGWKCSEDLFQETIKEIFGCES